MSRKKKISIKTVLGAVLCIIFIPVIIINLILIFSTYLHPDEMPGVFGIKPVIVLSGSMEPEIMTGDLIFLHNTDTSDLKEGDVVCYLLSGKSVTHRITKVTTGEDGQPRFITRGDANDVEDRLAVKAEQIQGIWKGGRIGGLGNGIMAIQTPAGMVITILCPLLLFVLWDIMTRRKADREEMQRNARERAELEAELEAMKRQLKNETSGHSENTTG